MIKGLVPNSHASTSGETARLLRLRIVNLQNDQIKVTLTLPVPLVNVAQRLGAQLLPPTCSIESLLAQAELHGIGHLSWTDEAHQERLELTVE